MQYLSLILHPGAPGIAQQKSDEQRESPYVHRYMYQEGNAMHHCVGQCKYYNRPNSLVFSARIDGERIETVELSLDTFKVLQSRGVCNQNSPYHDEIIALVQNNVEQVRKRMTA